MGLLRVSVAGRGLLFKGSKFWWEGFFDVGLWEEDIGMERRSFCGLELKGNKLEEYECWIELTGNKKHNSQYILLIQ